MKYIHSADIHLDSPLNGLQRYEGAPVNEIREATRRTFEKLIDLAITSEASFVLLSGDLFDGDWPDFNTGLFFVKQMGKLKEANIRVFIIRGNHDAESKISKNLPFPSNVTLFPSDRPDTKILEDLGVAIHGQSYSIPATTTDLAAGYPQRKKDCLNIGMLHTCLTGREGHENYAPCQIDTLISKGYDYWALGHVHKREVLTKNPWIIFPGNLQGRNVKETGEKGCELVTFSNSEIVSVEQRILDVFRWHIIDVNVSSVETKDDLLFQIAGKLQEKVIECGDIPFAVRLRIIGNSKVHNEIYSSNSWKEEIRATAFEIASDQIWIEKIEVNTSPIVSIDSLMGKDGPISDLIHLIQNLKKNEGKLKEIPVIWSDLKKKIPPELLEEGDFLPQDLNAIRKELSSVEEYLIPLLFEEEPNK